MAKETPQKDDAAAARAERREERANERVHWTREMALAHAIKLRVSGHAHDDGVDAIINDAEAFRQFLAGESVFVEEGDTVDGAGGGGAVEDHECDEGCRSIPLGMLIGALFGGAAVTVEGEKF